MATKRGNGEGSITKLAESKYMGKIMIGYKCDGSPNRVSVYGKTRKEVSEKLIKLASQAIDGNYIIPSKLTFGDWLLRWLRDYKSINLKPRTYDTYESQITYNIIPVLGMIELKDLKAYHLQQYYNSKFNSGKGLSSATIRKIHNIIQASLKQAIINGLISRNPSIGVELPKLSQREIKVLTAEEQVKFFEAAKSTTRYDAFLIMIDTGVRMGELLALTWDDVDLKTGAISINKNIIYVKDRESETKSKYKIILQDDPKTRASNRKIPLTNRALQILRQLKLKSDPDCGLVFPSTKGTFVDPSNFERSFESVVKKTDIDKCNSHTLRHTFVTRCFEKGISVKIVSKWLGHSKISHTLDIYTHVLPDLEMDAIKILETPANQGSEYDQKVTQ